MSQPVIQTEAERANVSQEILRAPLPDPQTPPLLNQAESTNRALERLAKRLDELEKARIAHEDATRTIITKSFAERGSNINEFVSFGGTLETLVFWSDDFEGVAESDIVLDTVELNFDIQVNPWSKACIVLEFIDGTNQLFPTSEGDFAAIDRLTVRQAVITIGDITKYPLFAVFGRDVVPFGISTGDPVADVPTVVDPLTVEVFETREDFVMFCFATPTPPPPLPPSKTPTPPPPPVRPLLINPLVRGLANCICPYCGPPMSPKKGAAYTPPSLCPIFNGAVYVFNGDTIEELNDENHIEHIGGTLGYKTRGYTRSDIPWCMDFDVDVISSVFDSNFLQFEYRHFLDQIGFVPGMAAHLKSSFGPTALVLEWNGAVDTATFVDDEGTPVSIRPTAWQVAFTYQFDWNPTVEVIGAQGTYFVIGYSESDDLAGVTRVLTSDPLNPFRVGNVPEKRLSVGIGEWVAEGLRVAFEYSHAIDYSVADGGTGNSADGFFMQLTYEW